MRAVLTDWLSLESAARAALAFTFSVDGGHPDLVGGLRLQAINGDVDHACWRRGSVIPCRYTGNQETVKKGTIFVLCVLMCVR